MNNTINNVNQRPQRNPHQPPQDSLLSQWLYSDIDDLIDFDGYDLSQEGDPNEQ